MIVEILKQFTILLQKQISGDPVFFILSSLILLTAILVIVQNDLVRAGFTLIGCFGAIALLYFALGAELLAASQVLIYAVGITLVVVFAIMLLANAEEEKANESLPMDFNLFLRKTIAFGLAFFSFVLMSYSFIGLSSALTPSPPFPPARLSSLMEYTKVIRNSMPALAEKKLEMIGNLLLSEQVLAFELISVLLLIAFVSAILLSKKEI